MSSPRVSPSSPPKGEVVAGYPSRRRWWHAGPDHQAAGADRLHRPSFAQGKPLRARVRLFRGGGGGSEMNNSGIVVVAFDVVFCWWWCRCWCWCWCFCCSILLFLLRHRQRSSWILAVGDRRFYCWIFLVLSDLSCNDNDWHPHCCGVLVFPRWLMFPGFLSLRFRFPPTTRTFLLSCLLFLAGGMSLFAVDFV